MIKENIRVEGIPIHKHWLIPEESRPKIYIPHPSMSADEIRHRTQKVWDSFYQISKIWKRSRCASKMRARLAFVVISKLYRQMYAKTGITTDSARKSNAVKWTRFIGKLCFPLFSARELPNLQVPQD
ncbi:MAG: hypothetical protein P8Z37_16655 [Acidobacteriota bacterium]